METFIGRQRELETLDRLSQVAEKRAQFLVVYGRRRIGKTALLKQWAKTRHKKTFYWVATPNNRAYLLRNFSRSFLAFIQEDDNVADNFTYPDWEIALREVARYAEKTPFTLILDEFTYATQTVTELAGILQNMWDHHFRDKPLFLIISGSHVHMMQQTVEAYTAPLYGRVTARLHLHPLHYGGIAQFLPHYKPDELVAVNAIVGGVPAYLETFQPQASFSDNLRQLILNPFAPMQADPALILHEQFDEPRNYTAILSSIAQNKRTSKEIATQSEIPSTQLTRYLSTLVELRLVERRLPITEMHKPSSRKGRYYITDAYLRFYYRFIDPYLNLLEFGQEERLVQHVSRHLRAFVGEHSFEELARQWVAYCSNKGDLGWLIDRVGGYWGQDAQIDAMAINMEDQIALLGECKWSKSLIGIEVVEKLARQTPKVLSHLPDTAKWHTHLYIFSRTPLTAEAQTRASELKIKWISLERLHQDLRGDVS